MSYRIDQAIACAVQGCEHGQIMHSAAKPFQAHSPSVTSAGIRGGAGDSQPATPLPPRTRVDPQNLKALLAAKVRHLELEFPMEAHCLGRGSRVRRGSRTWEGSCRRRRRFSSGSQPLAYASRPCAPESAREARPPPHLQPPGQSSRSGHPKVNTGGFITGLRWSWGFLTTPLHSGAWGKKGRS